ncbi:MAG: hypothetical protein EOO17_04435 [Chloroflexi bacterium]|nr:MAG: hypothetical protein EOO17_04435 [Chloroflexota bacterium]
MNESIQSLKSEGSALLQYDPQLRANVEYAARMWMEFCSLPIHSKQHFVATSDGAGSGYELKNGIGKNADYKENFDIAQAHNDYLESLLLAINREDIESDFIRSAMALSDQIAPLAVHFAELVEEQYDLKGFANEVRASSATTFIRFIHYFGDRSAGDLIAEPHVDQSGFTFHLYESASGCERLNPMTHIWESMPVTAGKAAVIPAMQLQLRSNGELKALAHRVLATDATKNVGRSAIVGFVRLNGTPNYDKTRHGRLQEREPGFNYSMNQSDFADLFQQ